MDDKNNNKWSRRLIFLSLSLLAVEFLFSFFAEIKFADDLKMFGADSYCIDIVSRSQGARILLFLVALICAYFVMNVLERKRKLMNIGLIICGLFCYAWSTQVIRNTCDQLVIGYGPFGLIQHTYSFDPTVQNYNNTETVLQDKLETGYEKYDYEDQFFFRKYLIAKDQYKWVFNGIGPLFKLADHKTHTERHLRPGN